MTKRILILLGFFVFLLNANGALHAQTANASTSSDLASLGIRIEPDKRVLVVLAALDAARTTDANGDSVPVVNIAVTPEGSKFRELLRSDLAAMPAALRSRISTFVIAHKKRYPKMSDAELIAPFISMAYALSPVPDLADPLVTRDLPGSLLDVLDFAPLARDFYRQTSISSNISEYVKTYQKVADGHLRTSVRDMAGEILTYLNTRPKLSVIERVKTEVKRGKTTLKNVEQRERMRTFTLVPELLAPSNTINFVNVKDDYFVIMPAELAADRDLSSSDVRRAFLQFVVDPLIYENGKDVEVIRPLVKTLVEERRKTDPAISNDVYLVIAKSLAAAIDAKQIEFTRASALTAQARRRIEAVKTDAEKRAIADELAKAKALLADETALRLSEDNEKGALLDFYFADQLTGFEGAGFDIASSVHDMLLSFDGTKEGDRLARNAEARKRAETARAAKRSSGTAAGPSVLIDDPVTQKLLDVQKLVEARELVKAKAELNQLLDRDKNEPRVHYELGRVASLSAESIDDPAKQRAALLEAKTSFEKVLTIPAKEKDPALLSLTYVALAKIYEFYDENAYAVALYDKAIQIGKVTGGAYDQAMGGKARLIKEK